MNKREVISNILTVASILLLVALSVGFGYFLHDRLIGSSDVAMALDEMKGLIEQRYYFYDDETDEALMLGALDGMAAGMEDVYARYYTAEEYEEEFQSDSGDYVGVGISVGVPDDVGALIYAVYEGSSAYEAGVLVQDVIISVNGHAAQNVPLDTLIGYFSQDEAVPDEITVLRNGEELHFTLRRTEVHIKRVSHEMLDDTTGYLQITEFTGSVAEDFSVAMTDLTARGATGVVIDLRDNPGGILDDVLHVANYLIPKGKVIATIKSKTDKAQVYKSEGTGQFDCDFAVLVNGGSASASELLTGALKDYGIARVVGTQTYGKGIVQSYFRMYTTSGWLKLTTDAYYTPNDICIHGVGITPDIVVEQAEEYAYDPVDMIPRDADVQLQAALEALRQKRAAQAPAA